MIQTITESQEQLDRGTEEINENLQKITSKSAEVKEPTEKVLSDVEELRYTIFQTDYILFFTTAFNHFSLYLPVLTSPVIYISKTSYFSTSFIKLSNSSSVISKK